MLHACINCHGSIGNIHLENVTLSQIKGARRDVDSFSCLYLNVVDALVVVLVIAGVVWGQQDTGVLGNGRAALSYGQWGTVVT